MAIELVGVYSWDMGKTLECELCDLVSGLQGKQQLLSLNDHWTLNVFQGQSNRPRFVIQGKRHVVSFVELSSAERSAMGDALALATAAIESEPEVAKVYVQSFNETAPGHLHIHLVPRFEFDQSMGEDLNDLEATRPELLQSVMNRVEEALPKQTTLPFVARASMKLTSAWGRWFSGYQLLARSGKKYGPFDAAELYVISWFWLLTLLLAFQMALPLHQGVLAAFAVVGSYRLVDIGTYVFGMLLNNKQTHLVGLSRSLILMLTNLLEASIATALILNAVNGPSWDQVGSAFSPMLGFELANSNWGVLSYLGFIAGSAVFFICAVLSLAIVVGKIGERFTSNN